MDYNKDEKRYFQTLVSRVRKIGGRKRPLTRYEWVEVIQYWEEVQRLAPTYIRPFEEARRFCLEGCRFLANRYRREYNGERPLTSRQRKRLKWRNRREGIVRRIKTLIYKVRQRLPLTPKEIHELKSMLKFRDDKMFEFMKKLILIVHADNRLISDEDLTEVLKLIRKYKFKTAGMFKKPS